MDVVSVNEVLTVLREIETQTTGWSFPLSADDEPVRYHDLDVSASQVLQAFFRHCASARKKCDEGGLENSQVFIKRANAWGREEQADHARCWHSAAFIILLKTSQKRYCTHQYDNIGCESTPLARSKVIADARGGPSPSLLVQL